MKIAWLALSALLLAAPAAAEPLSVDVLAPQAEVDASEIRAAIASELGLDVTDGTSFAPVLGRLEIAVDQGEVRIAYHPAAGTLIERTLALPIAPEDRVQMIAFVAGNLVRDQAGEIVDGLRPPPAPVVVIPPRAGPAPRPAPPSTRFVPATLGFVPPASIDRAFGDRVEVGFGVHALVGITSSSRFASISGLVDIQDDRASGAQIGGIAAITNGSVLGAQIAGIAAYAKNLRGVQIGGVSAIASTVEGVQIGGVGTIARGNADVQIAGLAAGADRAGVQIAGGVAVAERAGVQIAGIVTHAQRVDVLQIAGFTANAERVRGVQIAPVIFGEDVKGVQIGVFNYARKLRGLQIGVVNASHEDDGAIPIGLINYARNGRFAYQGWVESTRISAVALQHGTKYVHNTWAIGVSPDHNEPLLGAGLGVHLPSDGVGFDIDAMSWFLDAFDAGTDQLAQLRASIAVPLGAGIEVFGGGAMNVYIADGMDESASFHPTYERRTTTDGGNAVVAWPSAFAGLRYRRR